MPSPIRLRPLPAPDPTGLLAFIEREPSLIDPGMTLAGRAIPLPAAAGGGAIPLLVLDAAARAVAVFAGAPSADALEAAAAARGWLDENLGALRALVPALAAATGTRAILLRPRAEGAVPLAAAFAAAGVELIEASLFASPSGTALALRPIAPPDRAVAAAGPPGSASPAAERRPAASPAAGTSPTNRPEDPLAGIPLSAEEAAEFRRLAAMGPARRAESRASAAPLGGFTEN